MPSDKQNPQFSAPLPWQVSQWQRVSAAYDSEQLAHAYLFSGNKGLGKAIFVNAFANLMLCLAPISTNSVSSPCRIACGECTNCKKGGPSYHPDIMQIETDEGSKNIKIEQIRSLSDFVIRSSHSGGAKVAIIHSAHLLNGNAANALLKTLEEPSNNTYLFLITDYPGRLMATIRSRCQKLHFANPEPELASTWLHGILGEGNIDSLLSASGNSPLIALQLAAGDSLSSRQQFLQSLGEIKQGRGSIQASLSLASSLGEAEVLQHFSASLSTLIRYSLTGKQENENDAATANLCAMLNPSQDAENNKAIATALLDFYGEVENARKQLASVSNPNPQLIMESLLWRWSKLLLNVAAI